MKIIMIKKHIIKANSGVEGHDQSINQVILLATGPLFLIKCYENHRQHKLDYEFLI